ncbi:PREDICTED: haloacid dehalogenase-like hydrolase domain-containing protein 3 [Priapulus caudatus]|uniref:Haloacid dehalogenase-like hydrolase domain-containing protein 3 n=1 Tax=Priapulus caudatus TaxID=37621 RepID=A0ABM1E2U0_PRICU|nr:PREDICTED: haloacid dehalogenase-like hydrolase domain-containing protein 3 [Priapulus caudatus]
MGHLKLVTVDITNTIIRWRVPVGHYYANKARLFGVDANGDKLQYSFNKNWSAHWQEFPNYGVSNGMTSKEWWDALVNRTFHDAGYRGDQETLKSITDALYTSYKDGNEAARVLPNSGRVLSNLRKAGLKLGVISNYDERIHSLLATLNLAQYFNFVIASREAGVCKPHSSIFRMALEKAGVAPHEAAHIGDNPYLDYHAAKRAGMHAYLINQSIKSTTEVLHDVDKRDVYSDILEVEGHLLRYTRGFDEEGATSPPLSHFQHH